MGGHVSMPAWSALLSDRDLKDQVAQIRTVSGTGTSADILAAMDPGSPLVDIGHVIQLAVAPVFLLSGIGIILTVLTNRLARAVDRARLLEEVARGSTGESLEERRRELRMMAWRARLMNRAITLCTCSALLVALVVVLLFLGAFLDFNAALPVAALFILAMLSLIAALLFFLREVILAIAALKIGV